MGVTTRSVQSERRPRVRLHRNAKTTPHMRALLVHRIRPGGLGDQPRRPRPRGSVCGPPTNGWPGIARAARPRLRTMPRRRRTGNRAARSDDGDRRDCGGAPAALDGAGRLQSGCRVPRSTVAAHSSPRRPQPLARRWSPRRPSIATNGRAQASSCIWISSRWRAFCRPGHRIHGDRRQTRRRRGLRVRACRCR